MEQHRAATIVADQLCGTVSDPIIRNAQEQRQLSLITAYLKKRNYTEQLHNPGLSFRDLPPGTFAFRLNVLAGRDRTVNVPVDIVVQPLRTGDEKRRQPKSTNYVHVMGKIFNLFYAQLFDLLRQTKDEYLLYEGRTYGGGLNKIEPKKLARVPLPDNPLLQSIAATSKLLFLLEKESP